MRGRRSGKFLPVLPLLTRYPFLKISASFLKSIGISNVEELADGLVRFPEAVKDAERIVLASLDGRVAERSYDEGDVLCVTCEDRSCSRCPEMGRFERCNLCLECFANCTQTYPSRTFYSLVTDAKLSILRYIAARLITGRFENWVKMRFAVTEASFYSSLLQQDTEASIRLVALDLGVLLRGWSVHVSSFITTSARLRAEEWRLINRRFRGGYVEVTKREVFRIMEEFLRSRLFESPNVSGDLEKLDEILADSIKRVEKRAGREGKFEADLGEVDIECLPPCMKEILAELRKGMNVPHTARFAITSFLVNIGMSVDEIIDVFKTAPDFDEEKTRYQVEHIAGERGRGVEYTSPSCDTMRTYHNCVADCDVNHPLNYYRRCKKSKKFGRSTNESTRVKENF